MTMTNLIVVLGAMANMFFMNQKTIYVVKGKKLMAILASTISTILYVGIVGKDWEQAVLFAFGNAFGMWASMVLTSKKKRFIPRKYGITPQKLEEATEIADLYRECGLCVTTQPTFFNKLATLEVIVIANNEQEKETVKTNIPVGSIVTSEVIKFSTIWE